ncbi:MAG: ATP-binding cassette domain-containing protein [Spirochaetaceae bacterium]|jgi:ABC-type lipoprotein export system ATPase subunit|nr:ATP-binding cassette domain-containing protein [Spirochaetaceae bacterium]
MRSLTILGGHGKEGKPEQLELTLRRGDIVSVVGPTGAGKSRFLEDIECLAQADTPTGRRVLVDGGVPDDETRFMPERKIAACLSQNMNFVMDLSVREFIETHGESRGIVRGIDTDTRFVEHIIDAANTLTGESFDGEAAVTRLSGGQSRALMIADTALLSPSPVVLIDELENAGVDREKALALLVNRDKMVVISTHETAIALLGKRRVCIRGGAVREVIETTEAEKQNAAFINELNSRLLMLREMLREGKRIDFDVEAFLRDGAAVANPLRGFASGVCA